MQQEAVTVGVDPAKTVFQVRAIDADGEVPVRRQIRRAEVLKFFSTLSPCLVGMEARASVHHRGRELIALGHDVRLMPPAYVKPYVKRGKTDAADAEAICEAVIRPTITASAIAAAVPGATMFRSGRQFAAWLGLTPRPHSSGGIGRQGDGYLRRLLMVGATAVMRMARKDAARQPWAAQPLTRKPVKVATVALADKTARVTWAVMARTEVYAAAAA